jgi:hypothetical protein
MHTYVVDSGSTTRLLKKCYVVDSGGTTRQIKKIYVVDSGGTTRLVFLSSNNLTLIAGAATNATGYNSTGHPPFGSITPSATLNDGNVITILETSTPGTPDLTLRITGFSADPTASYISSISINGGTTFGTVASSYAYGSGMATWIWNSFPASVLVSGTSYPVVLVT